MPPDPVTDSPKRLPIKATVRQKQIAAFVAQGSATNDIAHVLGLSPRTVEHHIHTLASRLPGKLPPRSKLSLWWRGVVHREVFG